MPLSDHEQKLLAQMEQALYAEDPKFATSLRGQRKGLGNSTRLTVGVIGLLVGLITLVVGILVSQDLAVQLTIGLAGFVIMFAGAVFAATGGGSGKPELNVVNPDGTKSQPTKKRQKGRSSFMQRMEERWERRRDNGWQ